MMHHLAKQHNKTTSFIQARAYVDKIYKENVDRNNFFRDNINPIIANSIDQKASGLVMAYGQTNSGKTYTMTQESGVIHQAFNTIFQRKEEFDIKLQIFELRYSKSGGLIDDLFDPNVNQLRKPDRCTLKSLNENSWNQIKLAIDSAIEEQQIIQVKTLVLHVLFYSVYFIFLHWHLKITNSQLNLLI